MRATRKIKMACFHIALTSRVCSHLQRSAQTPSTAPAPQTQRPAFPTRDPHTPGYVAATQLPDGTLPPPPPTATSSSAPPILPRLK